MISQKGVNELKQGMLLDVEEKIKQFEHLKAKIQAARNQEDLEAVMTCLKAGGGE